MRYLRGIITWIDSLESGRQFRNWAAILVKILAVAILVGLSIAGIVVCVDTIAVNKDVEMIPSILVIIGSMVGSLLRYHHRHSSYHAVLEQSE